MILLAAAAFADAASVRAVVDRNQATVGESIALQVTIDGGEGDVDLSGLVDFKTVSRGTSSSFQMINGRTSRQLIHNYVLIPLKAGNLTIPAIPVTIDGKIHYTTPIGVTVSREPPADSGQRDVYVTAEVSDPAPWVGQQIVYTFRLFNAVQVADAKFQAPEFNGFTCRGTGGPPIPSNGGQRTGIHRDRGHIHPGSRENRAPWRSNRRCFRWVCCSATDGRGPSPAWTLFSGAAK